jgi:hypothetical protein
MSLFSLRKIDPDTLATLFAKRRVERGIRWINSVRPYDWWKALYNHYPDGSLSFRARNMYAEECVLAFAFESESWAIRATNGRSNTWEVVHHFSLSRRWRLAHGFDIEGNQRKSLLVTSGLLDTAWEREVRESPLIIRSEPVYPTARKKPQPLGAQARRELSASAGRRGCLERFRIRVCRGERARASA